MTTKAEVQSARVRGPVRGEPMTFDITAATQVIKIPEAWRGRWVKVLARSGSAMVQEASTSSISLDTTAKNTVPASADDDVAARNDTGDWANDGAPLQWELDPTSTHFGWRGTSAAGTITIGLASHLAVNEAIP